MTSRKESRSEDTVWIRLARQMGSHAPWSSLRVRLLLLVLLALLPPVALTVYTAVETRHIGIQAARENALSLVRMAARQQDAILESAEQLLLALSSLQVVREHDALACHRIFTNLVASHPVYANLGAADATGRVFASAFPLPEPVNVARRPFFQLATATGRFAIGTYEVDEIAHRSTLHVGQPVQDDQGRIQTVLYAALDLRWLYTVITNAALPPGSSLTVLDRDGVTLARHPDPEGRYLGQRLTLPPRSPDKPLPNEFSGIFRGRDGVRRLYAVTWLGSRRDKPVAVAVGIPVAAAHAAANRLLARNLLFLGLAAALSLAAAWYFGNVFVLRRVRRLLETTQRLAQGDLSARTGLSRGQGELHLLAQAFDTMADRLEQRSRERDQAEEALRKLNLELEQRVQERTAELERSNKELEQFAYVASHDLQEPLRMVTGYLQLLESRYADRLDEDAREFIHYARDGAVRMQGLIRGLLEYSRVTTRGNPPTPVDCRQVLRDVLTDLSVALEESGATVTHDEPLPMVWGDPLQIGQLFQNLISNAIKFRSKEPPRIHIGVRRTDGFWEFSVRDNGIGIDPRHFNRIFTLFQRLHPHDAYPGTGIGLALCQRIVQRHGGRIWVESQPGQGTTFYFTLPAVPEHVLRELEAPSLAASPATKSDDGTGNTA